MCKHVLNAQVQIRSPCCQQWFDCPQCHAEQRPDHELQKTTEMVFGCKKCKKVFRKDMSVFEEADEFCPRCDNHFVIPAKTPQMGIGIEGDDEKLLKDHRDPRAVKRSLLQPQA
eukprot:m.20336 g.20336  ORF g.20336 m.20336 type:complete len:114 (-) comp6140_c0_seq1:479-820(-)